MKFSSLGLDASLTETVAELGYSEPTPIQREAIPAILKQQDVMAGAQTGTGKTAAFALPIIQQLLTSTDSVQRVVRALVLTPTRELSQQVHKSFIEYSRNTALKCEIAYGGVGLNPQIEAMKAGADIVVATPGRLLDLVMKRAVDLSSVEHLVFDEADRMLDMGFIDEIKRILKHLPDERQTLLFSATFDDALFKLSKTLLNKPKLIEVNARNAAAAEVEQRIYQVDKERKQEIVTHLVSSGNWFQVLIFTRTKQDADVLARGLNKDGIEAVAIHGDKSQGARNRALEQFKTGEVRALIATDVASRGLDIEQLEYVINYELPYIAEDYIHRIGRTGRAGASGVAISLVSPDEEWLLEEIEVVLDKRVGQQWLPGFEPDLTREVESNRRNSKSAQKRRAKQRALGGKTGNRRSSNKAHRRKR